MPECNDLSHFIEDTGEPSISVREFNLCNMPISPTELKNAVSGLDLNPGRRELSALQPTWHCGLLMLQHCSRCERHKHINTLWTCQSSASNDVCLWLPALLYAGLYRILTVVFQTFSGQNYFFFQTFWGTLFIFMWTKNITNSLLNAEISYTMYSSILNTEWDSNF